MGDDLMSVYPRCFPGQGKFARLPGMTSMHLEHSVSGCKGQKRRSCVGAFNSFRHSGQIGLGIIWAFVSLGIGRVV